MACTQTLLSGCKFDLLINRPIQEISFSLLRSLEEEEIQFVHTTDREILLRVFQVSYHPPQSHPALLHLAEESETMSNKVF